ncbi:MAG: OmpA family protein [Candidatus Acidiferrales bacterium]
MPGPTGNAPGQEHRSSAPTSPAAPAPQNTGPTNSAVATRGVPKIALIAAGVVALFAVLLILAIGHAVHRARQKAAQIEAAYVVEKNRTSGGGQTPARAGTPPSGVDIQKNLNELAAAASALTQNGQAPGASTAAQGGPSSPNAQGSSAPANGSTLVDGKVVPANASATAARPGPVPMVPVAATGDQAHDWALEYERTVGGPEADLVVRTGDINNLGFGWKNYDWNTKQTTFLDPFSGKSTQPHQWPDIHKIPPNAPAGTDRIMLGSAVIPGMGDGYSGSIADCITEQQLAKSGHVPPQFDAGCKEERALTAPTPIPLLVGELPSKINAVVVQMFVDDFQPMPMHSHFQVSLNGTRIPNFEYAINALDQSGPIGKLLTLKLLPEYWPLLKSDTVKLLIDDPTTHVPDGYAVDFVRILVNPRGFKYQVSLTASVSDADKHTPITGATVTAALDSKVTDRAGKCQFAGLPAGLVTATANAPGYDENSVQVDLPAGQAGQADIQLHRHQESTAALEQSIAQTGTVSVYGIHFDTGSSKLRPDSLPALQAVLGLIERRAGSNWIIAGHTDNQGSDALNIPLSKSRAASVVSWLTAHGVAQGRMDAQGFGATRPVADNATPGGRALNRRVEVSLGK